MPFLDLFAAIGDFLGVFGAKRVSVDGRYEMKRQVRELREREKIEKATDSPRTMTTNEERLLGEWRQIIPPTGREQVFIAFQVGGDLTYTIEAESTQKMFLAWKVEGDTIVTDQPSAPRREVTRFSFKSASILVLERPDERYEYERI